MYSSGNGNGNGNGDAAMADPDFLHRLERSFNTQEKEYQKTRDDVYQLKTQQNVIQRDISTLTTTLNAVLAKIDERSRPNWPAIALAVTMFIAVVPGMGFVMTTYVSAAVSPITNAAVLNAADIKHYADSLRIVESAATVSQTADANSRTDRQQLNDRMRIVETSLSSETADRRSAGSATKVALTEVETQLRATCNADNLRAAQQERMNSMMWEKSRPGERYPNGTFFSPCIAHDAPLNAAGTP